MPYGIANKNGQVTLVEARSMLQFSYDSGVNMLDTAIGYGESEQVIGEVGVSTFKVVSKLLPLPDSVRDVGVWVQREVESSLARLKIESLYGLLLHRSSDLNDARGPELYAAMQQLKVAGFVRKIGISIYSPAELDACAEKFDHDIVQSPFNLIDHRLLTSGWLHALKQSGCEVHVRSSFLQGLLLMPRKDIPTKFSPWKTLWDTWHEWLEANNEDPVRACLAYPLSFPEIDRVVIGALDLVQLRQNIRAAKLPAVTSFPEMTCEEENLINPARWSSF